MCVEEEERVHLVHSKSLTKGKREGEREREREREREKRRQRTRVAGGGPEVGDGGERSSSGRSRWCER